MFKLFNTERDAKCIVVQNENQFDCATTKQMLRPKLVLKFCLMFVFSLSLLSMSAQTSFFVPVIPCAPGQGPLGQWIWVTTSGGQSPYTYTIDSGQLFNYTDMLFSGIASGSYIITTTDANNVAVNQNYTMPAASQPIALTANITVAPTCQNNTATACANATGGNGGTFSYTWFLNGNIVSGSACPTNLVPGVYTIIVQENGCHCTTSTTLTIAPSSLTFTATPTHSDCTTAPFCNGSIALNIMGTQPYSITWTGNGAANNVNTNNFIIPLLCPGNYNVVVTDANGCTNSQLVIINLNVADVTAGGVGFASNNINGNVAWIPANFQGQTTIVVDANVTVTSTGILNITGLTVLVTPGHYIRVLGGGQLIANLTNFDAICGVTWQGLQGLGATTMCDTQAQRAEVHLTNCSISHANIGFANNVFNNFASGGMITATNTTWQDNVIDVDLRHFAAVVPHSANYGASFTNCTFMMLNGFPPPTIFNNGRIILNNINDVRFDRCSILNFIPAIYGPTGIRGLVSNVSQFKWIGNNASNVQGFLRGMEISGFFANPSCATGVFNNVDITSSQFNCVVGIFLTGANSAQVIGNTFGDDPAGYLAPSDLHYGVQIRNNTLLATTFLVADNNFNYINTAPNIVGTFINNCKGNSNYILRNQYTNCDWGIDIWNRNRAAMGNQGTAGLHFECNTFTTCSGDVNIQCTNAIDCLTNQTGVAGVQQDTYGIGATFNNSAGNNFTASTLNPGNVYENDVQVHNTTMPFTYHYNNGDVAATQIDAFGPTEMSRITNPDVLTYNFDIVTLSGHFPAAIPYCGNINYVIPSLPIIQDDLEYARNAYQELKSIYTALVDGGNTEALVDNVLFAQYAQAWQLYQSLLSESPALSNEVMLAAIQQENDLPASLLTIILASNPSAAKDPELLQALEDRANPLSAYQMAQILMGRNSTSTKEILERDLGLYRASIDQCLMNAIRYYCANPTENAMAELATFFSAEDLFEHRRTLAELLMTSGDFEQGEAMMQNLAEHFGLKTKDDEDYTEYAALLSLHHAVINRAELQLTLAEKTYLEDVLATDPCGLGNVALNLLVAFAGYQTHDQPECLGTRSLRIRNTQEEKTTAIVYPNPVQYGFVILKLAQPVSELTTIEIIDNLGRTVSTQQLSTGLAELPINIDTMANGVYTINIRNSIEEQHINFVKQ